MLNFKNFEYAKFQLPGNAEEKKQVLEELKQKFIAEVKESELCRNYFSQYDSSSIDEFVAGFANRKLEFVESFELYMKLYNTDNNEQFLKNGRFAFNCILQKKLFNLQVQWRAGQMTLEGIQTTYDFDFWEHNIEHCPFISPVTQAEMELMKKFLSENYFSNLEETNFWHPYHMIMFRNDQGDFDNMPDWYSYYDTMFGTGKYLLLPDTRGEKERFYIQLSHKAEEEKRKAENNNKPLQPVYLPKLYAWQKEIFEFSRQCETNPYFKELFTIWYKYSNPDYTDKDYDREFVDRAIDVLENADRPVMLLSNMVWHQAIIEAAERYVTIRTIEAMDAICEEYITLADLGITNHFTPEEETQERKNSFYAEGLVNMILDGRELNGEPRNFDF